MSAVNEENRRQMEAMADELCQEYIAKSDDLANKNDMTALFRIGYGLGQNRPDCHSCSVDGPRHKENEQWKRK